MNDDCFYRMTIKKVLYYNLYEKMEKSFCGFIHFEFTLAIEKVTVIALNLNSTINRFR